MLFSASILFSQANNWVQITGNQTGLRPYGTLVYLPDSNSFILSMGTFEQNANQPYTEMRFNWNTGQWINLLPNDSLYGKWANLTGNTFGKGIYKEPYFGLYTIDGYLRPNLYPVRGPKAYYQYAYNSDDGRIYYYLNNKTISYDTRSRRWNDLNPATNPVLNCKGGSLALIWGAMCYDPVNQEILLFGGGGADVDSGNVGTWIYKPSNNTWTRLTLAIQPPPRAMSQMVYDAKNKTIVLFGGDHLDYLLCDTWIYDCTSRTWVEKSPSVSPPARAGHALLYLPRSKKIVLIGGYKYTSCSTWGCDPQSQLFDIWVYDVSLNSWQYLANPSLGPKYLSHVISSAMMVCDTADNILALGDTIRNWYMTAKTFKMQCDPSITDAAETIRLGIDGKTEVHRTGSYLPSFYDTNVPAVDTALNEQMLKSLTPNTWTKITPPKNHLFNRDYGYAVYDSDRDLILRWAGGHASYHGNDMPQYSPHTNRWHISHEPALPIEFNYANAMSPFNMDFYNRPMMTGHTYSTYSYDPAIKRLVLFTWRMTYLYNPATMLWEMDKQISNHPDMVDLNSYPEIRMYSSLTGTPHGTLGWIRTKPYPFTTGLFLLDPDSLKWNRLSISVSIPPFYGDNGGAAYDSKRDRVMLYRGGSDTILFYNFKTSSITKTIPQGTPANGHAGRVAAMTYDAENDVVYIQGGIYYDCENNSWKKSSVPNESVLDSYNSGMMYDPNRKIIFGNETNGEIYAMKFIKDTAAIRNEITLQFALKSNITVKPNPFNPSATFSITLNNTESAKLQIFNSQGELIKQFFQNTILTKGFHSVTWNGKNDSGKSVASGTYICKFNTRTYKSTFPILLIK